MKRIITILILIVTLSQLNCTISQDYQIQNAPVTTNQSMICQSIDSPAITWISRTQQQPQLIENGSIAIGDHVILNASFPESYNITNCSIRIWNGFTFTTTRPLVPAHNPGGAFTGIINRDDFDWVIIKGIEKGLLVNISCNFTNSDSDFMAWDGSIDPDEYTYANNIAELASSNKPETDSFIWTSDNDTMVLGCLNYVNSSGTWTPIVQVGADTCIKSLGSSVSLDTYFCGPSNGTYNVEAFGSSNTSENVAIDFSDVEICNFFAPRLSNISVLHLEEDENAFNISWSCQDSNADDINLFSLYLSNNDGYSFMLIALNRSQCWYIWNSTGWFNGYYIIKIRAYSIDISAKSPSNLIDISAGYWPGDYSEVLVDIGLAGDVHIGDPISDVHIVSLDDFSYVEGTNGNYLDWQIYLSSGYFYPSVFYYTLYRNDTIILYEKQHLFSRDGYVVSVNIDNLTKGVYKFEITFRNPGTSGGTVRDVVYITVLEAPISTTTSITHTTESQVQPISLVKLILFGISGSSLVVIVVVVVLFIRKRNSSG